MDQAAGGAGNGGWQVICLCAAWCSACREWRVPFDEAAAAHPQVRFDWVDIEDQAEAIGEVDVETFPTVLIAHGRHARFYGPVLPSAAQLSRLLVSLQADTFAATPFESVEAAALLQRLHAVLPR